MDSLGAEVSDASPSIAVQMGGLGAVPTAGDEFAVRDGVAQSLTAVPLLDITWTFDWTSSRYLITNLLRMSLSCESYDRNGILTYCRFARARPRRGG